MDLPRQHPKLRPPVLRVLFFAAIDTVAAVVDQLGFAIAVVLQPRAFDASGHEVVHHSLGAAFGQIQVKGIRCA